MQHNHEQFYTWCLFIVTMSLCLSPRWMRMPWPPCWLILLPVHLMMKTVPLGQTAHKKNCQPEPAWLNWPWIHYKLLRYCTIFFFQGLVTSYNISSFFPFLFQLQATICRAWEYLGEGKIWLFTASHHPPCNWHELDLTKPSSTFSKAPRTAALTRAEARSNESPGMLWCLCSCLQFIISYSSDYDVVFLDLYVPFMLCMFCQNCHMLCYKKEKKNHDIFWDLMVVSIVLYFFFSKDWFPTNYIRLAQWGLQIIHCDQSGTFQNNFLAFCILEWNFYCFDPHKLNSITSR